MYISIFSIQNNPIVFNPFLKIAGGSDNIVNKSFLSFDTPKHLELDFLIINGKVQCLFKPIPVTIERVDDSWLIENERIRISAIFRL